MEGVTNGDSESTHCRNRKVTTCQNRKEEMSIGKVPTAAGEEGHPKHRTGKAHKDAEESME